MAIGLPDQPARMIHVGFDAAAAAAWAIDALPMPFGYEGARAYPGSRRRLLVNQIANLDRIMSLCEGQMTCSHKSTPTEQNRTEFKR